MLYIVLLWRLWILVSAVLFFNALAKFVFSPSKKSGKGLVLSIPFILIWPLTAFSPEGRKLMFNKLSEL